MMPLRQLVTLNIEEARSLGLVVVSDLDSATVQDEFDSIWASASTDLEGFGRATGRVRELLIESMAWLLHSGTRRLTVHRVTTIRNLERPLRATRDAPGRTIEPAVQELAVLIKEIEQHDAEPEVSEAVILEHTRRLHRILEELRVTLCRLPPLHPVARVPAIALHKPAAQAWVAFENQENSLQLPSQQLRDALGLVHYPDRRERAGGLLQSLVHLSFAVEPVQDSLPPQWNPEFLVDQRNGLWLVRPTVCHEPNERFVQRHSGDQPGTTALSGRTINIGTRECLEGVPELILVHGEDAELGWEDLRLLTPPPTARPDDDDHDTFLRVVASRLGRPVQA